MSISILNNILSTVVKTNVTGIVMVGLIIMVIILVAILTILVYLFVENYEYGANSRFYRTESTPKSPILQPSALSTKPATERYSLGGFPMENESEIS